MNLCDRQHDEICYEGRRCPLCDMRDEKDAELADLRAENNRLEHEMSAIVDNYYPCAHAECEALDKLEKLDGDKL